jgi:hypothetical protein
VTTNEEIIVSNFKQQRLAPLRALGFAGFLGAGDPR